jgi:glycosyltransferase involved in cell wall biosynthesis
VITALIHDWLITFGGAEKTFEQMVRLHPEADIFTMFDFLPEVSRDFLKGKHISTSFLQRLPFAEKKYRSFLPLMPLAVEQFDLSPYDLVISSSHAVAKGVLTGPHQLHICYCHTPMRYAWDLYHQYLKDAGLDKGLKGRLAQAVLHYIRIWDYSSAQRVDYFVANSRYVAARIRKNYGRDSKVIHPPVDLDALRVNVRKDDYYMTASRMVPYKKTDLIVEAFSGMPDKKLLVAGDGPEFKKVKAKAGKNIELLGHLSGDALYDHLGRAKAFVFAAEEDFGILPVEAQACGTPVIAYGKGGVLETTIEHQTAVYFREQTVAALRSAVREFEKTESRFDSLRIRAHAEKFGRERFESELKGFVDAAVAERAK